MKSQTFYKVSSTNKTDCHVIPLSSISNKYPDRHILFPVAIKRLAASIVPFIHHVQWVFDIGEQVSVMKFLTLGAKQQIIDQPLHN
jgi:hypothetical protein